MAKLNLIGVDLAKTVIDVCRLSPTYKLLSSKSLSRKKFSQFLAQQPPSLVVIEACSGVHYCSWIALEHGHQVKIISAKAAAKFRSGHKTDKNDAIAVAMASTHPKNKPCPIKSPEQLAIQLLDRARARAHLVSEKTALSNLMRAMMVEFGIIFPRGFTQLKKAIPDILEDGENILPDLLRPALSQLLERFISLENECKEFDKQVKQVSQQVEPCQRLQELEGVGIVGSNLLYATIGTGQAFKNGREASACIGVTPKQYSSGGKVIIKGIGRAGNTRLRSVLIQGARSVVHKLKTPQSAKTDTQRWLWGIIQRSGYGQAAVALANKNVRIAWAMLRSGDEYQKAA